MQACCPRFSSPGPTTYRRLFTRIFFQGPSPHLQFQFRARVTKTAPRGASLNGRCWLWMGVWPLRVAVIEPSSRGCSSPAGGSSRLRDNPSLRHGSLLVIFLLVQFSSVIQSCPTFWDPMDCTTPGLPVHHQLLEFA